MTEKFRITGGKGFQITFANGWTASVQFGPGNYCDNRSMDFDARNYQVVNQEAGDKGSSNAEIAAWDAFGKWHDFGYDTVSGDTSPSEALEFLNMIAAKPRSIDEKSPDGAVP